MTRLAGRRVLVVEDDYIIATDVVDMLSSAGAVPVGPVGWEDEALALVQNPATRLDLAILDIDLHGTPSYRVANALIARDIPFIFTTGFGVEALDAAFRDHPRLEKPVSEAALTETLEAREATGWHPPQPPPD